MKAETFIRTIYQSLYSRALYVEVLRQWKGIGFFYLLLLLSLHWIPEMMKVQREISERLDDAAPHYIAQVPLITVSKGKASIREASPFYIYEPDNTTVFAFIDTSGRASLDNTTAAVLLTETKLITRNSITGSNIFDLSQVDKLVIDHKLIYAWIEEFKGIFAVVMYPFALFFSFLFHVFQASICAFMGKLFSRIINLELDFKALLRLSVVASTPGILLQTAHTLLGATFPFSGPITFVISLGYLYFAVQSCALTSAGGVDKIV